MHLNRIALPVLDAADVAEFYRTTLGLPVRIDTGTATVSIGRTQLVLQATGEISGPHHLAMTIPRDTFAAARSWLERRAQLLSRDGKDEFEGPSSWNSRSLYFDGPERAVLELIERRDLPSRPTSNFSTGDLLCVSEVGIAVDDVEQAASQLERDAGIETYGDRASSDFAAVGDVNGLLILVRPGRVWLPTTDRRATITPTRVEATGPRPGTSVLGDSAALDVTG